MVARVGGEWVERVSGFDAYDMYSDGRPWPLTAIIVAIIPATTTTTTKSQPPQPPPQTPPPPLPAVTTNHTANHTITHPTVQPPNQSTDMQHLLEFDHPEQWTHVTEIVPRPTRPPNQPTRPKPTNQPAHTSSRQHSPEVEHPEQWEHVAEIVLNSDDLVVEAVQHLQLWEATHILDATGGAGGPVWSELAIRQRVGGCVRVCVVGG
jgi:hypothetical protein